MVVGSSTGGYFLACADDRVTPLHRRIGRVPSRTLAYAACVAAAVLRSRLDPAISYAAMAAIAASFCSIRSNGSGRIRVLKNAGVSGIVQRVRSA